MEHIHDLIIIGAGPAGLSAAIYAKRAMLDFKIIEKWLPGGEIANTFEVENYLGLGRLTGMELADKMVAHAQELGVEIENDPVISVDFSKPIKRIKTETQELLCKTVVIASGASAKKLGVKGENRLGGLGVSYCATCDGFLYKGKTVAVVGGGDVAVEDAIYLSRIAKKVILIHRRDELRAVRSLQERLFKIENVEIYWSSNLDEIYGKDFVEGIKIKNNKNDNITDLEVQAVFIGVGYEPNVDFLNRNVDLIEGNWIKTDINLETNHKGVFAAGDVRDTHLRQIVTAVSDGALAVTLLAKYL
ncbi:MAG: thioredoxin-disulfide reductase [Candidatus Izemoplasmatales bacterium]